MTTHKITFPGKAQGYKPLIAEVEAPSHALAVRAVLEHVASEGIPLEFLNLSNITGLAGARLDGLRLTECKLFSVDLSGTSLKGARIEHTEFEKVIADNRTCLDDAYLENVQFVECVLNGLSAKRGNFSAVRFSMTEARALDVEFANFSSVRNINSNLTGWRAHMAYLHSFEDAAGLIESADLTVNQKAALRTLAFNNGNRAAAQVYLDGLESNT
jgi:uncharacterized protein YjbI with pentapeptide repeats